MRRHTLSNEGGSADRGFHCSILHATANDALVTSSSSIGAAVSWTTEFKQRARALARGPIPHHVCVYDAIEAADPEAAYHAMADLIELALIDTTATPGIKTCSKDMQAA